MTRTEAVDYTVTDDYDALLYGAPRTIREFTSEGTPKCMDFDAMLSKHHLTREQLVDIAILCGTDYNHGVPNLGPERALAELKAYGSLERVCDRHDVQIPNLGRIRNLFLESSIRDEYEFDTTISPDIDGARRYMTETWEVPRNTVSRAFERLEAYRWVWE